MTKASDYTRDLSKKEIKVLQQEYALYLKKASRNRGFIPNTKTKRLLHYTNWTDESSDDIYQFFSDLKAHTRSAFWDIQLLCDTLKPSVLSDFFTSDLPKELEEELKYESDSKRSLELFQRIPSIENAVRAILFSKEEETRKPEDWQRKELLIQLDAWKFDLASSLIRICFEFLQENKFITSKSHERLVEEVIDMIQAESHNISIPKYWRNIQWV